LDNPIDIHLLFPKVVAHAKVHLTENQELDIEKVYNETKFCSTRPFEKANVVEMSESLNIMDELPILKEKCLTIFNSFKNSIMRQESTQFKMTTSWFTKTRPGQNNGFHKHGNQDYSMVFYFKNPKKVQITFEDFNPGHNREITSTELNQLNRGDWTFDMDNNELIIFPSEVYHKIQPFDGEGVRKSIAMNLTATGEFGFGDSKINVR
tara:strand:+ start:61 stop:684 length:624 start_codon:yes stop_codon:yes gene_type:complete